MGKIIAIIAVAIIHFAFTFGIHADAQALKRIQFPKGKTSATVTGTTGNHGVTYVIRAKAGQKLIINLTPVSKVGVKVETVGTYGEMVLLREERGGTYEVGLEETRDYTIFIGSTANKPVSYSLTVKIVKLADI